MKKFLLMFAAVAAIAFVGCKTETKPVEEAPVEEAPVAEYTVDGVAADLLNCADEAAAVSLLDGIKAKAEELLNGGDQAGYFNIINILKTVWDVPENLKAGFADFVAKQAAEKVGQAVDAATDAAAEKVDAAKEAVQDAAGNAVDAAKEKGAEAAQAVADELKK